MESLRLDMDINESSDLPASFLDNPLEAARYLAALRYDEFVQSLQPRGPAQILEIKPGDLLKADAILKLLDPFLYPTKTPDGYPTLPTLNQRWTPKLTRD